MRYGEWHLSVSGNNITNTDGLTNLVRVQLLFIEDNDALTNRDGLSDHYPIGAVFDYQAVSD